MNSVELIGRLTKDPIAGNGVARFPLALSREGAEGADYPNIVVFGKQAETVVKYLYKGKQVAIQGRIQTGSYTNKYGDTVYTTEVVAHRVEFVGNIEKHNDEEEKTETPAVEEKQLDEFEMLDEDVPF